MASRPHLSLLAVFTLLAHVACDDVSSGSQGVVRGRVRTQDGSKFEPVTVRSGTKSVQTDAEGNFVLPVKSGGEQRVSVESKEFAGGEARVNLGKGDATNVELGVMRVSKLEIADAEKGGRFEGEDGFSLKLPEKALRTARGSTSKGGAEIRYASVRDAKLMRVPPELRTSDGQGHEQRLKSHGLIEVRFFDGDEEQLAIAATADVEVPLPESTPLKDGDRVDLYHYDTESRRFEREGEAEVKDGKWHAKLAKFSWWTIAEPAGATGCVSARLLTPSDEPAAGVVASAVGVDELWLASAVSDESGELCLEAPAGGAVELTAFWDDGRASGEWSETAEAPARAATCGGVGCLDLGSQPLTGAPDGSPDAGGNGRPDAGAPDGGGVAGMFGGLRETKTASAAGETVSFTFSAAGGERLAYTLESDASATADIRIVGPDGNVLSVGSGAVSASTPNFDDAFLLPALSGEYTLEVTPRSGAGTFTLDLFGVPDDATEEIGADGEPVSIEVSSVAQNASLTFNAEGGERLAYSVDSSADTTTDLWLIGPAGNRLGLGNLAVSSGSHGFSDQFVLPTVAGEYRIQVDPRQQGTGSFELRLFSVPEDAVVDVTADGPPASLTIPELAQNGAFRLRGASGGERLAYILQNGGATTVDTSVLGPTGTPVAGANGATSPGSSRFADTFVLPSTPGDYLFSVDPRAEAVAGSFTLELLRVPADVSVPASIGGSAASLSIPNVGQNGAFTFSAAGGERLAYTLQSSADGTADISIVDPNGQTVSSSGTAVTSNTTAFHDQFTLPAVAGSYKLSVDPRNQFTGGFVATLIAVPADALASFTLQPFANASAQNVTTSVAGQNAALDVAVTAPSAVVAYYVTNNATNTVDVELLGPGGAPVSGSSRAIGASSTGFIDAFSLGAAGTYRFAIDPRAQGTGTVGVRAFQITPPRPTVTVTPNASAARVDVTIPGQIAVFSFTLSAGQTFGYSVARVGSSSVADIRLLDPAQREITPSGSSRVISATTPVTANGVSAASAGTYTLEVDPRTDNTDGYTMTLTTP